MSYYDYIYDIVCNSKEEQIAVANECIAKLEAIIATQDIEVASQMLEDFQKEVGGLKRGAWSHARWLGERYLQDDNFEVYNYFEEDPSYVREKLQETYEQQIKYLEARKNFHPDHAGERLEELLLELGGPKLMPPTNPYKSN